MTAHNQLATATVGPGPAHAASRRVAWTLAAISFAAVAAQAGLILASPGVTANYFGFRGAEAAAGATFTLIGVLIVPRQRLNPVGWLLLVSGVLHSIVGLGEEIGTFSLFYRPGAIPGDHFMAWIAHWLWIPAMGTGVVIAFLRFPDGRLMSRRWASAEWLTIGSTAFATSAFVFVSPELDVHRGVANPTAIAALENVADAVTGAGLALFATCMLLAVASLWIRLRRSAQGTVRQQLKLAVYVQATAFTTVGLTWLHALYTGDFHSVLSVLSVVAVFSIPTALGVAMLRYGLYEIDVIINRTIVYVPLSALLAGLYVAGVGVLRTLFTDALGVSSDAAVAIMAVAVVASTTPLKNKIQSVVDNHFKEVINPAKRLNEFAGSVDHVLEVLDRQRILRRFLDESAQAFEAQSGQVRLLDGVEVEIVHSIGKPPVEPNLVVPITWDGAVIGELTLGERSGRRKYSPADIEALSGAARLVGEAMGRIPANLPLTAAPAPVAS